MKNKPILVFYHESFLQSVLSDAAAFGFLIVLAWISRDNQFWSGVSATIGIFACVVYLFGKHTKKEFFSKEELKKFVDSLE